MAFDEKSSLNKTRQDKIPFALSWSLIYFDVCQVKVGIVLLPSPLMWTLMFASSRLVGEG